MLEHYEQKITEELPFALKVYKVNKLIYKNFPLYFNLVTTKRTMMTD